MNFEKVQEFILKKLSDELNPLLLYHSVSHTVDVIQSAEMIARLEGVDGDDLLLLKTAALFHDSGMLVQYTDHEVASTMITREVLPKYGYSDEEIKIINRMILTTRLPQTAETKLEKIICDADLDYLGRDDFFMIAHRLQYEWNQLNVNKTTLKKWYELQLNFLLDHEYFTESAKRLRNKKKKQNIEEVKELLNKK